jgi:nicotinamidase-related amidase
VTNPGIALLLVDVIHGFDFHDSEELVRAATEAVPHIATLAASARRSGVPVIYVNDNFGMWQSDFRAVAEKCMRPDQPGREVTRRLLPQPSDYFVLKPRHSGFLGTPLEALLAHLGANVLVFAGFATDLCVLFTAVDAHTRGFHIVVASDSTAANDANAHRTALTLLEHTLQGPLVGSSDVDWRKLAKPKRRELF